jgi:ABC-type transporter Mla subunit MlaD
VAGSKSLTYEIGIDAGDAVGSLKTFSNAVKSAMRDVESELDDGATAGEKLAAALDQIGSRTKEEFASAATAAEEMGRALKAAGSSLDVADVLPQLQRLGLSFDEVTQDADKLAVALKDLDDVKATGLKDLDATAPGLASKLDDVNKSADSSRNALANMVGNSVQDVTGLGGALGVALGQLAEFGTDAKPSAPCSRDSPASPRRSPDSPSRRKRSAP